jgi:hypothetical protein
LEAEKNVRQKKYMFAAEKAAAFCLLAAAFSAANMYFFCLTFFSASNKSFFHLMYFFRIVGAFFFTSGSFRVSNEKYLKSQVF